MPIIKRQKESAKCRIVFLSDLCQKTNDMPNSISHNQVMHAGPCLQAKLTVGQILLRFGSKLLCFDLKKKFLQILIPECDQNKVTK